jgi:anti-sigma-K factor RskA
MSAGRHDAISAMLGEYALGHLSAEERREVEAHLLACAACTSELREYTLLMDAMARTPEPVSPPAALRQRVLGGLVKPQTPDPKPQIPLLWPLAAAAAVVLGVGATLWVARDGRRAEADLRATIVELEQRIEQFSGQTDLALSILTAGDMRPIALAGQQDAVASAARAYWSPTRGLLIVADRLPTPPPGRIYQVWLIGGGAPVSAGLLGSQGAERGMLIVPPPPGIAAGMVTVAVTDEPPGGLAAPTGAMRLVGAA